MLKVGLELERSFEGKASRLVESSGKSAVKLVELIARHFPGIIYSVLLFYFTLQVIYLENFVMGSN